MFNTTNLSVKNSTTHNSTTEINNPSFGEIARSNDESYFVRFKLNSELEKTIFNFNDPHIYLYSQKSIERDPYYSDDIRRFGKWETAFYKTKHLIKVIKVLVFGENEFLVEYIKLEELKPERYYR